MTNERIQQIKDRLLKDSSLRSDDFDHDTHALLIAESKLLSEYTDDIVPFLLQHIEKLETQKQGLKTALLDCAMQGVDLGIDGGPYKSDFVKIAREALEKFGDK